MACEWSTAMILNWGLRGLLFGLSEGDAKAAVSTNCRAVLLHGGTTAWHIFNKAFISALGLYFSDLPLFILPLVLMRLECGEWVSSADRKDCLRLLFCLLSTSGLMYRFSAETRKTALGIIHTMKRTLPAAEGQDEDREPPVSKRAKVHALWLSLSWLLLLQVFGKFLIPYRRTLRAVYF